MMKNIILNQDLSIMENDIIIRYSNTLLDHSLVDFMAFYTFNYIQDKKKSIAVNVNDIYDHIITLCYDKKKVFDDFAFNVSLITLLNSHNQIFRLAFFMNEGWVILKIKGLCISSKFGSYYR